MRKIWDEADVMKEKFFCKRKEVEKGRRTVKESYIMRDLIYSMRRKCFDIDINSISRSEDTS